MSLPGPFIELEVVSAVLLFDHDSNKLPTGLEDFRKVIDSTRRGGAKLPTGRNYTIN